MKLTQELKEQWLTALKSGKYVQTEGWLYIEDTPGQKSHCCLGVLVECLPGVSLSSNGSQCIVNGKPANYDPIYSILGFEVTEELYGLNDNSFNPEKPDYSNVIPFIENLICNEENEIKNN